MDIILTACIPLLLLAAMLRGLKHQFYALHILMVGASCWLTQILLFDGQPIAIFSATAITVAIAAHLLSINIVTWLAYYYDKKASQQNRWRIPERTLHAFALIGGTPAAWVAQKKLRHKNRKQSFQLFFWIIFAIQAILLTYFALSN